ncbi:radical SAM protein [Candidatus Woesearchaeota archaeon]|nr:radical SAM protein [Candidatus Woesearchaeota archaeon]
MMIQKTSFYSWKTGNLAKGCRLCVDGSKLVLFATGLCPRSCFYCPLSEQKKNKDVVYADEWKIEKDKDIISEAQSIGAKGASLTGGDPFMVLNRSIKYIRLLKKAFGKKFHIHLYTLPELLNYEKLKKFHDAGLDELRLHPDIFNKKNWAKIDIVKKFKWQIGVEIPVIPGQKKKIIELIDYFADKINFLNLNELEISDTNANKLLKMGFRCKDEVSYGIKGSEELAFELLRHINKKHPKLNVHYCTAALKDKVQLANRIKRRAKNTAKDYDIIGKEGMLARGAVYLSNLKPGFSYRKRLGNILKNKKIKNELIKKLNAIKNNLKNGFKIKNSLIAVDRQKLRILTSIKIINKISKTKKGLCFAIVEEYPTWDQTEMSVEFLQ